MAASRSTMRSMNVSRSILNNNNLPRSIHSTALRMAGGGPPIIQGEGSAPGEVPTDESQSTGLERFELLGKLQGVDVFDMKPLESSRLGTKKEPIMVQSLYPSRIVGCTGSPAGSHDTTWIHLKKEHDFHRCPECGSVYKLDFTGDHTTDGSHH
ncbi:putative COX4-cytochrome-c oxidase chain IV [Meira miltonrushii]|uniref:Cytochrome c oxidase subunit 4, mitochondrial n=1 Tax=Meira miltonrushii TaxID=1280837 RepID=A0A316V9G8_9BASI|nr:putative COX4-cytochrome-c oxidase chain IV [Meira miltonrushii]PWN33688.1 putative COX4-cytochrome-c oxidase chain IV [Meira miltonrushii]